VRDGHLSRAARALGQTGFLDSSDPVIKKKLELLHPPFKGEIPECPDSASETAITANRKFKNYVRRRIAKGQAPGPAGWTGEMLIPLLGHQDVVDDLCIFLSDFKNGRLPRELKPFLLPATCLSLEKEDGEPRPVALGEVFYRLVTSWSIDSLGDPIAEILYPIQMGLGITGGVETVSLLMQAILTDEGLKKAAVATDLKNAYNVRDRDVLLKSLFFTPFIKVDLEVSPLVLFFTNAALDSG